MQICALASGSKGNCVLIAGEHTKILIDIGLSLRRLESTLLAYSIPFAEIAACLITHEHIDHIKGAKRASEKHRLPLHAHPHCAAVMSKACGINAASFADFDMSGFTVGEFFIEPFSLSHDSVAAVGYRISDKFSSFVYATDFGVCSNQFLDFAAQADTVLIESNHDVDILKKGRYPAHIKRRILSNYGHLSNAACALAVEQLACAKPKNFILGHISEENNIYELALSSTKQRLKDAGIDGINLFVAKQNQPTGFIRCKQ